jgi:hypothetical protein
LIAELERLTENASDRKVGLQIRAFLAAYRAATANGNQAGIRLKAESGRKLGARESTIYAYIATDDGHHIRVMWLPMLVVPLTTKVERIMQESGWAPRFPEETPRPRSAFKADDESEGRRPFFGSKPELRLIRPP